ILLIHPTEAGEAPPFTARLILVPLDGDPAHAAGLPVASQLAQATGGALYLIMVIPSVGSLKDEEAATAMLMPLATNALLGIDAQRAEAYLSQEMARLRAAGLSVHAEVARGNPAAYLLSAAHRLNADLIVLGTHGKAGLQAFWSGSVAPKIAGRPGAPLLLVP